MASTFPVFISIATMAPLIFLVLLFFVPCFLNSNFYCRYGGFFTSKNLALCAEGIAEFLNNNGTMQLVLSPLFTKEDVDAIKKGITNREEKIKDNWIKSYEKLEEKFAGIENVASAQLIDMRKIV